MVTSIRRTVALLKSLGGMCLAALKRSRCSTASHRRKCVFDAGQDTLNLVGASERMSRATWVRERSLATLAPPDIGEGSDPAHDTSAISPPASDDDDTGGPLRPDLYCLDHDRRIVIPIEFTVADDANLSAAVGRKHAKYDPWLLQNPCASIARLVPGARDPHSWTFDPLVVVAIGVWDTVPHSTVAALTALGLSVAAANAALGAALESIAHGNMLISRLRHSSPTRWRGA